MKAGGTMQKLFFEQAWDKTIGQVDRDKITKLFQSVQSEENIHFFFLWEAQNHRDEHLVTVLIHNPKTKPLQLAQTPITYRYENKFNKTALFTLPIPVPAQTSMPWTFIFTDHNQTEQIPTYFITKKGDA